MKNENLFGDVADNESRWTIVFTSWSVYTCISIKDLAESVIHKNI